MHLRKFSEKLAYASIPGFLIFAKNNISVMKG
jgi:hypothetical protein